MESAGKIPEFSKHKGSGIVSAAANTGNPLRGDFERMARRRFQYPTPRRRGDWWTIQVRHDVFVDGKFKRSNKRVRLAPATMPEREVRKVAAEYLRPEPGVAEHGFSDQLHPLCGANILAGGDAAFREEYA
jgi:hypothetical protein